MSVTDLLALIGRTAALPFEMAETLPAASCSDHEGTAFEVRRYTTVALVAPKPSALSVAR